MGSGAEVKDLGVVDANVKGSNWVGGLAGYLGKMTQCYSTGVVSVSAGTDILAGWWGTTRAMTQCYSTGVVSGKHGYVGGLVGENFGVVTQCYSTGTVSGDLDVGGLMEATMVL